MKLSDLIISSAAYIGEFDYDHYPSNFEKFKTELSTLLSETDSEDFGSLVSAAINEIDEHIASLPFRAKNSSRHDIKQVMALFAVPSGAVLGDKGIKFGDELMNQWNSRYKKFSFIRGDFDTIMKGFDANLLGLPLRKSKFNRRNSK